jgi:DNA-binding SARP family transcriptional activator
MSRLRLQLLGGFRAFLATGRPVTFKSKKAQALLAYLALTADQGHPRSRLAALLWGDSDDLRADASLRQARSIIGRTLEAAGLSVQLTRPEGVGLAADALDVDVTTFERSLVRNTPRALSESMALYRGDLLAGFLSREPAFEEWLRAERERFREKALDALDRLLTGQVRTAPTAAVDTALRLLALDPTRESAHRALMRLYVERGRESAALRQYEVCAKTLDRELGVPPQFETRELYHDILRRQGPSAPARRGRASDPSRTSMSPPPETPLIGRAAEWRIVEGALRGTLAGAGARSWRDGPHRPLPRHRADPGAASLGRSDAGRCGCGRSRRSRPRVAARPRSPAPRGLEIRSSGDDRGRGSASRPSRSGSRAPPPGSRSWSSSKTCSGPTR